MIIQYGERVTIDPFTTGKVAFEVHLPHLVRMLLLKSLKWAMLLCLVGIDLVVTTQDGRDRAGTWYVCVSFSLQSSSDLAPSPSRMLLANCEHCVFHLVWCAQRYGNLDLTIRGANTQVEIFNSLTGNFDEDVIDSQT